jgi:predicted permease
MTPPASGRHRASARLAPKVFDWLLRRSLPSGSTGDSIRGDLIEELSEAADPRAGRRRFRAQAISIAIRYAFRRPARSEAQPRKDIMDTLTQQLKFAARSLVARPSYALIVIATLALGIGANTAVFSVLHALVLRSLPVADPARLVLVMRNGQPSQQFPLFQHFQANSKTVDVLAFRTGSWRFSAGEKTERITGALVSGSYFAVLGISASLGTTITNEDDTIPGSGGPRGPVAVLSHGFWMRQFGGEPGVIGSSIVLNARPFTIVGVAPAGFLGTEVGQSVDVLAPMMMQPTLMPGLGKALGEPRSQWLRIIGRLRPGVDPAQAGAELTSLLRPYNEHILRDPAIVKFGANYPKNLREQRITVVAGSAGLSSLRTQYSQPLFIVMAVMGLVLLIACANIANLSLGRAAARRREVAIRLGLGASRRRLVGQLLTESLLLAAAGGLSGLLLARWGRDVLLTYLPIGQTLSAPLDFNVLLFTLVVAIGAALLFGLAPAYQSTRVDIAPVLKGGVVHESARSPFRKGLVVFQVGVSLVVVIGAVLFLRSLDALLSIDAGFTRKNVLVASVDVVTERDANFYGRLLAALKTTPGVVSAALAWSAPLGTNTGWLIYIPGYVPKANEPTTTPWVDGISPGYFRTMGTPIMLGRDFDDRDVASTAGVMIVNETFARHYFGDENPVGRHVGLAPGVFDVEIVGVVKDGKYTGLREQPVRMMYVPHRERIGASQMTVLVRTAGEPLAFAATLRQKAAEIDRHAILHSIATAQDQIDRSLLRERLVATISGLFGVLALLLAAIGLYGVLSYGIARRTREFGIRIAIGAEGGSILRLVLREAAWVLASGIVAGLTAAWWLGRIVGSLLYGVQPGDLTSLGIAVGVLAIAGTLAAWIPARRASRIDPIQALRYE